MSIALLSIRDADPPLRHCEGDARQRIAGAWALLAESVVETEHRVMRDAVDARVIVDEEPVGLQVERRAEMRAPVHISPDALATAQHQQPERLAPFWENELPRLPVGHIVEGANLGARRRPHLRTRPGRA